MVPPGQRLDADDHAGRQVHLGLVVDVQALRRDGRRAGRRAGRAGWSPAGRARVGRARVRSGSAWRRTWRGRHSAAGESASPPASTDDADAGVAPRSRRRRARRVGPGRPGRRLGTRAPSRLSRRRPGAARRTRRRRGAPPARPRRAALDAAARRPGEEPVPDLVAQGVVDVLEAVEVQQAARRPARPPPPRRAGARAAAGSAGRSGRRACAACSRSSAWRIIRLRAQRRCRCATAAWLASARSCAEVGRAERLDVADLVGERRRLPLDPSLAAHRHHHAVPDARRLA